MATARILSLQESLLRGVGETSQNGHDHCILQTRRARSPGYVAQTADRFAVASPSPAQQSPARIRRTPALPAPAVGALLLTILIIGALAATSSPILQSPVILRLGAAVRRLLRREATPTDLPRSKTSVTT